MAIVENIRLDINCTDGDAIEEARKSSNIPPEIPGRIYKKSIDARHKNNIKFNYSVIFDEPDEKNKTFGSNNIQVNHGSKHQENRPVIAGFGPAGMFCALLLAEKGYKPVVFEMGSDIDTRIKKVNTLFKDGIIDEKTNVCFGEGGAGTFSDGKLTTRINDEYCGFILNKFVQYGASDEILYQAKPHIGTDKIRVITKKIREEIIKNGGEVFFDSEITDINIKANCVEIVVNNSEEIKTSGLFLAAGHSAFGLYDLLMKKGFSISPKPYSIGFRIEHNQSHIDEIIYGNFAGHKNLPPAEYVLSYKKPDIRGVYTFCMCPGGVVVNSSSENGGIVTNGMSYSDRAGKNANAAIAVSILPEDYGDSVNGAFEFRKKIETAAFMINKNFTAPVQTLGDYINNKTGSLNKSKIPPSYTGKTQEYDINKLFPDYINKAIKNGLTQFDKTLKGYLDKNAVLTAPETRTSSAVRILRDKSTFASVDCENIYPCGEGSGYAGGITSSAVDGIKCAVKYMEKWKI